MERSRVPSWPLLGGSSLFGEPRSVRKKEGEEGVRNLSRRGFLGAAQIAGSPNLIPLLTSLRSISPCSDKPSRVSSNRWDAELGSGVRRPVMNQTPRTMSVFCTRTNESPRNDRADSTGARETLVVDNCRFSRGPAAKRTRRQTKRADSRSRCVYESLCECTPTDMDLTSKGQVCDNVDPFVIPGATLLI